MDYIKNIKNIIGISEFLFDKISELLDNHELLHENVSIQIWNHIKFVEEKFSEVISDLEKKPTEKSIRYHTIKNKNNEDYNPDGFLEKIIKSLTLILRHISFKYNLVNNGKYIFPNFIDVTDGYIEKTSEILSLAYSWIELKNETDYCFLFNGVAHEHNKSEIAEIKNKLKISVDITHSYFYPSNEFLFYNDIASERFRTRYHQELMTLIEINGLNPKDKTINENELQSKIVDIDKKLTHIFFFNYFCCDIEVDLHKYNKLRLIDWVNGYFALKLLSNKFIKDEVVPLLTCDGMIEYLIDNSLGKEEASIFLDAVTFGKNSVDLFDCPILQMENNEIYLVTSALHNINVFRAIASRLPSIEKNLGQKGYDFENHAVALLRKHNINAISINRKFGKEEYEFDTVFIFGDKIFLLECKNKNISWGCPVKAFRNIEFYDDAITQIKRLVYALNKHPEIIQDRFGVDVNDYKIIPIIYNCFPFSIPGNNDGIYIADHSSFSRLLQSNYINNIHLFNGVKETKYKQWQGAEFNEMDIINHISRPFQLRLYEKTQKYNFLYYELEGVAFSKVNYFIDHSIYEKNQNKLFGTDCHTSKPKKNKIKSLRIERKKSKRVNRHKK